MDLLLFATPPFRNYVYIATSHTSVEHDMYRVDVCSDPQLQLKHFNEHRIGNDRMHYLALYVTYYPDMVVSLVNTMLDKNRDPNSVNNRFYLIHPYLMEHVHNVLHCFSELTNSSSIPECIGHSLVLSDLIVRALCFSERTTIQLYFPENYYQRFYIEVSVEQMNGLENNSDDLYINNIVFAECTEKKDSEQPNKRVRREEDFPSMHLSNLCKKLYKNEFGVVDGRTVYSSNVLHKFIKIGTVQLLDLFNRNSEDTEFGSIIYKKQGMVDIVEKLLNVRERIITYNGVEIPGFYILLSSG